MTRVLVTGGGTSGHISPALAIISALRDLEPDVTLLYMGSHQGMERQQAEALGVPFVAISTGKLRRYLSFANLLDQFRLPLGLGQALGILLKYRADVVLATGGYVAVPPVVAAGLLRLPVLVHEQTAQVGLANRINARFATRIALSWESALPCLSPGARSKAWVSGNPIRPQIFGGDAALALEAFELSGEELPTIYVTGGSLGARVINRAVAEVLPQLLQRARVIHQCGEQKDQAEQDFDRLEAAAAQLPPQLKARYAVRKFIRSELKDVFTLADLVIGRAGAGTVTELCALGKPAIYVPLMPTGGDEQTKNATLVVNAGAAVIVPQAECTGATLLAATTRLLDGGDLVAMGAKARPLVHLDAARELAKAVLLLGNQKDVVGFDSVLLDKDTK